MQQCTELTGTNRPRAYPEGCGRKFQKVFGFEGIFLSKKSVRQTLVFLDSSAVEHSAVNRRVVGSNPTRGVFLWSVGQAVKTSPFHGGNTGSIPVGVT